MRIQLQSGSPRSFDSESGSEMADDGQLFDLLHTEGSAVSEENIEAADLGDYIDVNTMHIIN